MKRKMCLVLLLGITAGSGAMAQGRLGKKLLDKASGTSSPSGTTYSSGDLKKAAADSTDALLDGKAKELKADPYGFNGIYYANTLIGLVSDDQSNVFIGKKFLVEFNDKQKSISLKSRYAYEANDRAKFVPAATFIINRDGQDYFSIHQKTASKKQYFESFDHVANGNYQYLDFMGKTDLQGNAVKGDPYANSFKQHALQYAPGILVIFESGTAYQYKDPEYIKQNQFRSLVVLYKAEKQAEALKITTMEMHEFLKTFLVERNKLADQASSDNNTLPKKVAAAQAPSQKDMMDAVKKRAADYGWKETLVYCYTTSEWLPRFEPVGRDLLNTLTGRTIAIVAVFKKADGSCAFMNMTLEQLNSYGTPGNLKENYTTPVRDYANSGLEGISCDKSMTYK